MRPFRSLLLRRVVAAVLVAAVAMPLASTAGASARRTDALQGVLDDATAFDAALRAARAAHADPLGAFADAYEQASGGGISAEAIERLLGADSMSGVLPVAAQRAWVSAQATSPAGAGAATLPDPARLVPLPLASAAPDGPAERPLRAVAPASQPRAP